MSGIINEMRLVVAGIVDDDQQANDVVYALIRQFGGDQLYLPCNDYEMRNKEIKTLYKAKVSVESLAKRFKLSPKTIYRIIK